MSNQISLTQTILNECRVLYENLTQSQDLLEDLTPEQQAAMASDNEAFNELQTKVCALDLELKKSPADISQDERCQIKKWLAASAAIIDLKNENNAIAWEISELISTVNLIFRGIDFDNREFETLEQVSERIFTITSNERINASNYTAAQSLQAILHVRMERSFCPFHPSHFTASQVETFNVTLFQIQCDQLKQSLKDNPPVDFEVLFQFYITVLPFYLETTNFICPNTKSLLEKIVNDLQDSIGCIIESQKRIELNQARQHLLLQQGKVNLEQLSDKLGYALNASKQYRSNRIAIEEQVQIVFSTLSSEDKEQIFHSLSQILLDRGKMSRPLRDHLKTQPFCTWYICYECRLAAVQDVLSKTESPPLIVKRVNRMIQRMEAAQKKMSISLPTLPDQNRLSTIWSGIQGLYRLLFLIHSNASEDELAKGAQVLENIQSTNLVALLQIEENTPILITDRLTFHYRHIYKCKELSITFSLENATQLRLAIQRTLLELTIEGLENVLCNGISGMDELLSFLDQLEMEDNDPVVELFKASILQFLNPQISTLDKFQSLQGFRANLKNQWGL